MQIKSLFSMLILTGFCSLAFAQYPTYYTVALDGSGDFTSIQKAIEACKSYPEKRITIFIKNGIYREKVRIPECNSKLSLIGESKEQTIITWGDYFNKIDRGRNSTFYTYTLLVEANDFYAENLTIENAAGPVGQAVALHIEGDRCIVKNCNILGNQDTLFTAGETSRQYFIRCYIEGTTDFIFGAAIALFDSCTLYSKSNSYITAASTPEGNKFGYVFRNCKLLAPDSVNKVYLGRPWRDFARVVFMFCEIGAHIRPEGWSGWGNRDDCKLAYYAEYKNFGPGASTVNRIGWSYQLTDKEAADFTSENILKPVVPFEPNNWFVIHQ